jgi:exonuclease SbcD
MSPAERLRLVFPNLLTVLQNKYTPDNNNENQGDFRDRKPGDLFQEFYKNVTGRDMNEAELNLLDKVIHRVKGEDE